jgi:hypothetical protein
MATTVSVSRSELIGQFMERNPAATIAQVQQYLEEQHSLQATEALIANVANRARRRGGGGKPPAWRGDPARKTAVPKTAVPKTAVPKTAVPQTAASQTAAPQTAAPETIEMEGISWTIRPVVIGAGPISRATAAAATPLSDARRPGAPPPRRNAATRRTRKTRPAAPVSRRTAAVATASSTDADLPVGGSPAVRATRLDMSLSIECLLQAKRMAEKLGGVSQARAALDTLSRLLD